MYVYILTSCNVCMHCMYTRHPLFYVLKANTCSHATGWVRGLWCLMPLFQQYLWQTMNMVKTFFLSEQQKNNLQCPKYIDLCINIQDDKVNECIHLFCLFFFHFFSMTKFTILHIQLSNSLCFVIIYIPILDQPVWNNNIIENTK